MTYAASRQANDDSDGTSPVHFGPSTTGDDDDDALLMGPIHTVEYVPGLFCSQCGEQAIVNKDFCMNCGAKLNFERLA